MPDMRKFGTILVVAALLALLVVTVWYAYGLWTAFDTELPGWIYGAMAGGVILSLVVGCGLMALVFYSSRYGYDDRMSGPGRLPGE